MMITDSRMMTTPDENIQFLDPLPRGLIQIGGIEECVCDYDFYNTGDEDRAKGCGGIYYQRYYLDSQKMIHCDRTPCACMIPILQQRETEKEQLRLQERKDLLFQKCQRYFSQYDLLQDESHAHMIFKNYKPGDPSQAMTMNELQNFQVGKDGICLYGNSGRGKTHLALAVAHQAAGHGFVVLAVKSIDLLNRIKRTYDRKEDAAEADIIYTLKNIDLLVIDEVGIEKTTEWVTAKFYEIIDYRHKRRSTIFTTNFTGNELKDAPSQMPDETYRAWDFHHGTENCWKEDDPRWKVGKKNAGRILDGQEWNQVPGVVA